MVEFPIAIRPFDRLSDEDFVYATWIKSFRDSPYARAIPTPLYTIGQRSRICAILDGAETIIHVACDPDTPELIYGYAVWGNRDMLHYVYVKGQYRKLGIAKALLQDKLHETLQYTHKGDIMLERLLKTNPEYNGWIYNPYNLERSNAN